jgi:DeoR/GlpR family transcriptional regulator of sugar metabolism
MLKQIVQHIADGGTWTIETLAHELDTTPELVTSMLEQLVRQGYLKPAGGACAGGCASCSMAQGCVKGMGNRMWTLRSK